MDEAVTDEAAAQARKAWEDMTWEERNVGETERIRERAVRARPLLLADLRAEGLRRVKVEYDCFADFTHIDGIECFPDHDWDSPLAEGRYDRLKAFMWDVLDCLHQGFQYEDGSKGVFDWDIVHDRLDIDHSWRRTVFDRDRQTDVDLSCSAAGPAPEGGGTDGMAGPG